MLPDEDWAARTLWDVENDLFDAGPMDYQCGYCQAFYWHGEKTSKGKFNLCCGGGRLRHLRTASHPQPAFRRLLALVRSDRFKKHARTLNTDYGFARMSTPMGQTHTGQGPRVFVAQGHVYHITHRPTRRTTPTELGQAFFMEDGEAERVRSRLMLTDVPTDMIACLHETLEEYNPYTRFYRTVRETLLETPDDRVQQLHLPSFPSFLECLLLFGGASFLLLLLWVGLLSPPLLLEGAALPSLSLGGVFGWGYFSLLFCWVVPLGLPLLVVLLSLSSSLGWCCLASFVERCVVPSPFAWCRLPFPPSLGGARFSPLFCWVVLSTFSSFRWGCFPSLFCCLPSPPLGGAAFPLLFSWVVWLGLLRWVVLRCSLSFCVVLPSFTTTFGRVSQKEKSKNRKKNEVKNKK